jgi:glutamine cyclotransferase
LLASEARQASEQPFKRIPEVIRIIPHPEPNYTQGLLWFNGALFESVGLYGRSELRELDAESGKVRQRQQNKRTEFAEGLALRGDELVQLTWREGYALRYNRHDLKPIEPRWRFSTDGWGLAYIPEKDLFVRSDGTANLHFHKSENFEEIGILNVTRSGAPVNKLNELEFAKGRIFANVWGTNAEAQKILEIDPDTGKVVAEIDLQSICALEKVVINRELNGIAYNPEQDLFFITGKNWKYIYILYFKNIEQ